MFLFIYLFLFDYTIYINNRKIIWREIFDGEHVGLEMLMMMINDIDTNDDDDYTRLVDEKIQMHFNFKEEKNPQPFD